MAPLKRKRPHDHDEAPAPATATAEPTVTRRATRHSSTAPPVPIQPDPEPRRRRRNTEFLSSAAGGSAPPVVPLRERRQHQQQHTATKRPEAEEPHQPPTKTTTTRSTRHSGTTGVAASGLSTTPAATTYESIKPRLPASASAPTMGNAQPTRPTRTPIFPPAMNHATPALHPRPQPARPTARAQKPPSAGPPQQQPQAPPPPPKQAPEPEKPGQRTDRNIDKVVLGNICFKAWYPSFYGKEVLGDVSGNSSRANAGHGGAGAGGAGHNSENGGGKAAPRRDRDGQPMLDRLYVCPCCFKYSKELVTWWEHVRVCERRGFVPGDKIYVHPRGRRTVQRVLGPEARPGRKKRGDAGARTVEEVVEDQGEWSIWEVDGEKEGLFCQNLSLFAKLFLDNKSVFFDVTGFNYFLLVYTPPPLPTPTADPGAPTPVPAPAPAPTAGAAPAPPRPQIVGFFSKEKMSWDNNNLACILVFPPWQRKGLGALLMGVSYEISRRERVLGGPEKPISDLGRKGYKRFWAGEVARWLLALDVAPGPAAEAGGGAEVLVDVADCSRATWIVPEDCLLVLREMGVVEDAGPGPEKKGSSPAPPALPAAAAAAAEGEAAEAERRQVPRVRVDKEAVRAWVKAHHVDLERACDPSGFVDGYAIKAESPPAEEA